MPEVADFTKPYPKGTRRVIFGADQPEYIPLPALMSFDGRVTSCWKMNLKERLRILLTGKVFVQLSTFGKQIQPQRAFARLEEID